MTVSNPIAPGAFHFRGYLSVERQRSLVVEFRALIDGPVPAYVPTVRGGGKMHVRMLCLGRHWNGKTYKYETQRSDYDGLPAPPLPEDLAQLARRIADAAGMVFSPDLCILNFYDGDGRMGLHQDKDESERSIAAGLPVPALPSTFSAVAREIAAAADMPLDADLCILNYYDAEGRMGVHQDKDESERSIAAGLPVVSVSLGDSARFLFGGLRRRDPIESRLLESGDAFVFGGPARLRYHGVSRILRGTAPPELGLQGRFNLTLRQYDVNQP